MAVAKRKNRPTKGLLVRKRNVLIKLHEWEHEKASNAAKLSGLSLAAYARRRVLHEPVADRSLDVIVGELAGIGQALQRADARDTPEYQKVLEKLRVILEKMA